MKVLVDVNDNKADFILELLNNFPFAKAKPISPAKAQLLEEIKEAVENLNLVIMFLPLLLLTGDE